MNTKTDWLGWLLQALLGLAAGALLGLFAISRRRAGFAISTQFVPMFLWGTALIGAGLAARWGDNLWISYRVIPIEEPSQTPQSRLLALLIRSIGLVLVALAVLRHFGLIRVS